MLWHSSARKVKLKQERYSVHPHSHMIVQQSLSRNTALNEDMEHATK
jgi:hypothetical protein